MLLATETLPEGDAIDALTSSAAAAMMLRSQQAALQAVSEAAEQISKGANAMADAVRAHGSLVYAAAGSSGLMALADASELSGTFGIPQSSVQINMPGGVPVDASMPGDTEDNADLAQAASAGIEPADAVIVLSASGTTPYALAVAQAAKAKGATVIGIANNPNTALLDAADIAICLQTSAEVIAGSTRLGAGTAQKVALNLMSSLMGIELGHVYQGHMVNLIADNAKLIQRAERIVASVAEVSSDLAQNALTQAGGLTKLAVLIAKGCTVPEAESLLITHAGHLGPCFDDLKTTIT